MESAEQQHCQSQYTSGGLRPAHLVDPVALELKVKKMYSLVAYDPYGNYHFEMGKALAQKLGYPEEMLQNVPHESLESFAGVGYHFGLSPISRGDFVVDLGSGSGTDSFIASALAGGTGRVVGIDMTIEQLQKANGIRQRFGYQNISFRKGYIEAIPLPDGFADVVISNGVFNLSAAKQKTFEEAARVLKRGGKVLMSDIISRDVLPEKITGNATLWAACIGGAVPLSQYEQMLGQAGFKLSELKENPEYEFLTSGARSAAALYGIRSLSFVALKIK